MEVVWKLQANVHPQTKVVLSLCIRRIRLDTKAFTLFLGLCEFTVIVTIIMVPNTMSIYYTLYVWQTEQRPALWASTQIKYADWTLLAPPAISAAHVWAWVIDTGGLESRPCPGREKHHSFTHTSLCVCVCLCVFVRLWQRPQARLVWGWQTAISLSFLHKEFKYHRFRPLAMIWHWYSNVQYVQQD